MTFAAPSAGRLRRWSGYALSCALLLAGAGTPAREPGSHISDLLPQARLVGTGTFTWFGFHAYDGALFAADGAYQDGRPFALELTYARDFTGNAIARRSIDEIRKLGVASDAELASWLIVLKALFPDIRKGDRLAGVMTAYGTTQFLHNGLMVGMTRDIRLGRAFFAIWLDQRTSAPDFRAGLLGTTPGAR